MEVYEFNCVQCGGFVSVNEVPRRGNICFKCHIKTVDIGFKFGKENFHGPTIKERQDKIVSDAKAAGVNAVPAKDYGF
jgi:cytochrome c5